MYNMYDIEQIDKTTPESHSSTNNKRTRVIKQTDFFFSFQACAVIESRQWILTEGVIMLL